MRDWSKPNQKTSLLDVSFGPEKLSDFVPPMEEIPKEFHSYRNPWSEIVSSWFFSGIKNAPTAKEGIDRSLALRHIRTILVSFEPKHEHKIAGCAYLMSLWFDLPK